jgi:hypothetical protein
MDDYYKVLDIFCRTAMVLFDRMISLLKAHLFKYRMIKEWEEDNADYRDLKSPRSEEI